MELVPYLSDSTDTATEKIRVRIRQNALLAKIACKCIRQKDVALTVYKTIYLSHSTPGGFLANERWVAHELAHVRQFMTYGYIRFLVMYLAESLRKGYFQNKWEAEARAQEEKTDILQEFYFEYQL
ncbi:DUF4157 domain-containing protein [Arachidicoccus terrestris]|uniref:DUF4157 domain-containing protein n=1 Tax=Arachidicoccus terrestris TaxID=2875539 RepID=UPI001CC617E4|nr:DUF4157 domain-containing protein [Arachidicoccus terrestris]UAY55198.1 DUF4157 domain-containing protein [Arachidicoccus terrestris]